MKLCYRGISYEAIPTNIAVVETELAGQYRGAAWRLRQLQQVPLPQPQVSLKYRGVTYGAVIPSNSEQILSLERAIAHSF